MGGNLFRLPRMPHAEYVVREQAIRAFLDARAQPYRIPRYYANKPDFGDMDVIVPSRPDWDVVRAAIARDLGVTQTKAVGRVFSVAFQGLQTDFFAVPEPFVDSTYVFMSFNDLGNLLGRICKRFNLKWGEHGLSYVFRRANSDHHVVDLPLTTDFARVCAFLGLDHAAWRAGFADLPQMFAWTIASPYFSVVPYLDEISGTLAARATDRPTIAQFIAFLRDRGVDQRPEFADKTSYVAQIAAAFPEADLPAQLEAERQREARALAASAKFSGKLVMRLRPEVAGKALGELIAAFKRSIAPDGDGFEQWVLATPSDVIERRIAEFEAP
jgi:hypothetical protein